MKAPGKTVKEILLNQPEDRIEPFNNLHEVIVKICLKDSNRPSAMVDWVM